MLSTSGLYLLVFRILLHYKCLPSQQLSPPSGPSRGFLLPFLCFPLSSSFPLPSLRILAAILSVPLRPPLPLSRSCLAPAESCNLLSPHHHLSCFARLLLLFFHLASPPLSSSPATPSLCVSATSQSLCIPLQQLPATFLSPHHRAIIQSVALQAVSSLIPLKLFRALLPNSAAGQVPSTHVGGVFVHRNYE